MWTIAPLLVLFFAACHAQKFNVTTVLDHLLQGYDKRVRPNWGDSPVDIGVTMYFLKIFDMSTKEQNVKADFYFRQTWQDPRLAFDAPPGIDYITLGPEGAKNFWEPDTFFVPGFAKSAHDGNVFFRFNRDGNVLRSIRVLIKSKLSMDLQNFPLDQQLFTVSMESYGYSAKDVTYKWDKGSASVGLSDEHELGDMVVTKSRQFFSMVHLTTGNYSRLGVDIMISRQSGYYVRHFYLPAVITFLLVWASLWFSPTLSAVRMVLVIACFLISNYLLIQTSDHLPPVDYATKLEKYIIFIIVMSALAVAECALVVYLQRRIRKTGIYQAELDSSVLNGDAKPVNKKEDSESQQPDKNSGSYLLRSTRYVMTIHQHRRGYQKLDMFFRLIYPLIFIVHNICYWMSFP